MTEDHAMPQIRADQSMTVAASMVAGLIGRFEKPEDSEDELSTMHLCLLSVFLYQLVRDAKHKDKVAAILRCIATELEPPSAPKP